MDRRKLEAALANAFESDEQERRLVSRQARDLADSGQFATDQGGELAVPVVVSNLSDAPAGTLLVERWNWWIGSLDVAHSGYGQFVVQPWALE